MQKLIWGHCNISDNGESYRQAKDEEKLTQGMQGAPLGEVKPTGFFVGCLMSQQHASVFQGRIFSDKFKCCDTGREVADQTFYLTQSKDTDIGPASPSTDLVTQGTWQGSHWSADCKIVRYDLTQKKSLHHKRESNLRSSAFKVDALTTRPTRQ